MNKKELATQRQVFGYNVRRGTKQKNQKEWRDNKGLDDIMRYTKMQIMGVPEGERDGQKMYLKKYQLKM